MKNNSENIILENLGKNISKQLEKRDWSQKTFAEKLRYADTEFSPHMHMSGIGGTFLCSSRNHETAQG